MFRARIFPFLIFASVILVIISIFSYAFMTASQRTTTYLSGLGYHDVHTTGYRLFSCMRDEDAITRTGFTAFNENGKVVKGTVCWEPVWGNYLQLD